MGIINDGENQPIREQQLYYQIPLDEDGRPCCDICLAYYTRVGSGWWEAHKNGLIVTRFKEGNTSRFNPALWFPVPETLPLRALAMRLEETGKWVREEVMPAFNNTSKKRKGRERYKKS